MQGIVNATVGIIISILVAISPVKEINNKQVEKEIMTISIEKINLNRKIYSKR